MVSISPEEAKALAKGEVRELVDGSVRVSIPSIRLIRLTPDMDLHEHNGSITLVRVLAGGAREVRYKTKPQHWSRYSGGLPSDVTGADYGAGAEFMVWPEAPLHQVLALEPVTVILEAHWPPLLHSITYRVPKRESSVLVPSGEWFSRAERRRRFRDEE